MKHACASRAAFGRSPRSRPRSQTRRSTTRSRSRASTLDVGRGGPARPRRQLVPRRRAPRCSCRSIRDSRSRRRRSSGARAVTRTTFRRRAAAGPSARAGRPRSGAPRSCARPRRFCSARRGGDARAEGARVATRATPRTSAGRARRSSAGLNASLSLVVWGDSTTRDFANFLAGLAAVAGAGAESPGGAAAEFYAGHVNRTERALKAFARAGGETNVDAAADALDGIYPYARTRARRLDFSRLVGRRSPDSGAVAWRLDSGRLVGWRSPDSPPPLSQAHQSPQRRVEPRMHYWWCLRPHQTPQAVPSHQNHHQRREHRKRHHRHRK